MSYSETSTYWPRPSLSRAISASRMALVAVMPVAASTIGGPVRIGGPSRTPLSDKKPVSARAVGAAEGVFDVYPLGAEVGERLRAGRPGDDAGKIDHEKAIEDGWRALRSRL